MDRKRENERPSQSQRQNQIVELLNFRNSLIQSNQSNQTYNYNNTLPKSENQTAKAPKVKVFLKDNGRRAGFLDVAFLSGLVVAFIIVIIMIIVILGTRQ